MNCLPQSQGPGIWLLMPVVIQILLALFAIVLVGLAWRWLPEAGPFTAGVALLAVFAWLWLGGIYLIGRAARVLRRAALCDYEKPGGSVCSRRRIADYPQRRAAVYRAMVEQADQSQTGLREDLQSLGIRYPRLLPGECLGS